MLRAGLLLLVAAWALPARAQVASTAPKDAPGWGSVRGRVFVEPGLDDAPVKHYQKPLPVFERISRADSLNGVRPRLIDSVPNDRLLFDEKTRGVKNVLVWLKTRPDHIHPSMELDQRPDSVFLVAFDRRFLPRVVHVQVGQTLKLLSKDDKEIANFNFRGFEYHNFNVMVAKGDSYVWKPDQPLKRVIPYVIQSNVQPLSIAYCLITDHPYATTTGVDGSFRIDDLPAGKHKLRLWHEETGFVTNDLTINIEPDKVFELKPKAITLERLRRAQQ